MTEKNIHELVREDVLAREKIGDAEYGKPMRSFDGRNSLQDAYEEALDMAVYLRKAIEEQKKADEALKQLQETLGVAFGKSPAPASWWEEEGYRGDPRLRVNTWDRIEDVPVGVKVSASGNLCVYQISSSGEVGLIIHDDEWAPSVNLPDLGSRVFNERYGPFTRVE